MMSSVEDRQQKLLSALRGLGDGWHSRNEIAARLGKKKLNPSEVTIFEIMASTGVIEKSQTPTPNLSHILQTIYKTKEGN